MRKASMAIVALTTAVSLGWAAPAAAADPPPNHDALGYAEQRGISVKEAELRLHRHSLAPDLEERLETDLGADFGGVWMDAETDRVKVGVVKTVSAQHKAIVERAAQVIGLSGYDYAVVARPWSMLLNHNAWLAREIVRVNQGAAVYLSAGIRTDLNRVAFGVPTENLTPAQQALVKQARASLGDALVQTAPRRFKSYICVAPYCDWPLRGGVKINYPGTWCSSAFMTQSKVDTKKYLMTAGHCITGWTANWSTKDTDGVSKDIGRTWSGYVDTYIGDMAIIRVNDPVDWQPQAWIQVPWGPYVYPNANYTIRADKRSVLGMRICAQGAASKITTCGEVEELGLTANVDGLTMTNLGYATACGQPGDSGGPMFASHNAYGILIGGVEGECEVIYQGVRAVESTLNVNVLHTGA